MGLSRGAATGESVPLTRGIKGIRKSILLDLAKSREITRDTQSGKKKVRCKGPTVHPGKKDQGSGEGQKGTTTGKYEGEG